MCFHIFSKVSTMLSSSHCGGLYCGITDQVQISRFDLSSNCWKLLMLWPILVNMIDWSYYFILICNEFQAFLNENGKQKSKLKPILKPTTSESKINKPWKAIKECKKNCDKHCTRVLHGHLLREQTYLKQFVVSELILIFCELWLSTSKIF